MRKLLNFVKKFSPSFRFEAKITKLKRSKKFQKKKGKKGKKQKLLKRSEAKNLKQK